MTLEGRRPGQVQEASQTVVENLTAAHLGSGTLRVLATPAMVLFVEEVCRKMVEPHLAAAPMGQTVRCRAEVVAVEGGVITLRADVWDQVEKIGEAEHQRAVIDVDRFLRRVEAKAAPSR